MPHNHACKWCGDKIGEVCTGGACAKLPIEWVTIVDGKITVYDSECLVCFQQEVELASASGG